jgi:hypothetical protein
MSNISGCGAVGSMGALGASGRRFESYYPDEIDQVVKLLRQI